MTSSPSLEPNDLFRVKGLVAVVTGGATGIGLMIAKALEANGAKVFIISRRKDVLEKAAKEEAKHGNLIPIQGDATSKDDLARIAAHITSEVGYINLLVANAGIMGPSRTGVTLSPGPDASPLADVQKVLWDADPASFDQTFSVNVAGVYYSIVAFLPLLDEGNKRRASPSEGGLPPSQVIGVSSIGGFNRVPFQHFAYSASKAAVNHMMKQFATTLAPYGIRANVIAPGLYPSQMTDQMIDRVQKGPEEGRATVMAPSGRTGTLEDMAGVILWLASHAGSWINGNVVITDGGRLSVLPSTY